MGIDHVVIVSFGGFVGLTDALGGLHVDNRVPFANLWHRFAKGTIALRGDAALAYVRACYPFPNGYYQPAEPASVPERRHRFGYEPEAAGSHRHTIRGPVGGAVPAHRPGLDSGYVGRLAVSLRGARSSDVVRSMVPTDGTGTEQGQSVVYLDESAVAELASHLKDDSMPGFDACVVSIC